MLYALKVLLAVSCLIAQLAFADDNKCGTKQFACNIDKPFSTTCCDQNETCGISNAGKAQCVIPKLEKQTARKPSDEKASGLNKTAATKFETKNTKKK